MGYDNTNSGLLARNERKQSDTHPDFTGTINVDGVDYWLSAWVKEGREGSKMAGKKFFSLSVKAKEGQQPKAKPEPEQQVAFDDDIPF